MLTDEEIAFFVTGLTGGSITEGQAAAFAMAVFFRGMTRAEVVALTKRDAQLRHRARLVGRRGPGRPSTSTPPAVSATRSR